ncbi:MAG: O-antigen ligase family protein [Dehalococcoidia bacterium]
MKDALVALATVVLAVIAGTGVGLRSVALLALSLGCVFCGALLAFGEGLCLAAVLLLTPAFSVTRRISAIGMTALDVLVGLLVVMLLYFCYQPTRARPRVRPTVADGVVAIFLVCVGFSLVVRGIDAASCRDFVRLTGFPILMYAAGRVAFSGPHGRRWLWVAVVGALIAATELWLEHMLDRPLFSVEGTYFSVWVVGGLRAGSMLQGPNTASNYLAMCLAGAAVLMLRQMPGRRVAILAVGIIMSAWFTTKSISGGIEMLAVFGVLGLARGTRSVRVLVVMVMVILLVPGVRASIVAQPWYNEHDTSIQGRFDLLATARGAFQSISKDPTELVEGIGYGRWVDLEGRFAVGAIANVGNPISLHNTYLTILFENGMIAAACFVLLLVLSAGQGWLHRRDPVRLAGGVATVVFVLALGSGTLTVIPQVFGIAMFFLAAALTPNGALPDEASQPTLVWTGSRAVGSQHVRGVVRGAPRLVDEPTV